jgi:hypothetical protein
MNVNVRRKRLAPPQSKARLGAHEIASSISREALWSAVAKPPLSEVRHCHG